MSLDAYSFVFAVSPSFSFHKKIILFFLFISSALLLAGSDAFLDFFFVHLSSIKNDFLHVYFICFVVGSDFCSLIFDIIDCSFRQVE